MGGPYGHVPRAKRLTVLLLNRVFHVAGALSCMTVLNPPKQKPNQIRAQNYGLWSHVMAYKLEPQLYKNPCAIWWRDGSYVPSYNRGF
jgi:hypothetical protein